MERRPAGTERLLQLAWLCNLPNPESMPLAELKDALESRGYAVDPAPGAQPPNLNGLLPPTLEPEPTWLARRAATELAVDPDLRFLRFQDTVILEPGAGQPWAAWGSRRPCRSSNACLIQIKVNGSIRSPRSSTPSQPAAGSAPS